MATDIRTTATTTEITDLEIQQERITVHVKPEQQILPREEPQVRNLHAMERKFQVRRKLM